MSSPYKHLDMSPEYNRIITALTNITDDIRILRNRSEDGDGGNTKNEVMNGMQKALLAVSMSGAGGGNAEAVRQEIETPTAINGNAGAPAELSGEDAIYSGSQWSRAGQLAQLGIEEDIEEERFLIRVDGAFYYEAEGGVSGAGGISSPPAPALPPGGITSSGEAITNPLLTGATTDNVVIGDLDFGPGGNTADVTTYTIIVTGDITAYPFTVKRGDWNGGIGIYPVPFDPAYPKPQDGSGMYMWWSLTPGGPQLPGADCNPYIMPTSQHPWITAGTVGYGCILPNQDVTIYLNFQSKIGGFDGSPGSDIKTYIGGRKYNFGGAPRADGFSPGPIVNPRKGNVVNVLTGDLDMGPGGTAAGAITHTITITSDITAHPFTMKYGAYIGQVGFYPMPGWAPYPTDGSEPIIWWSLTPGGVKLPIDGSLIEIGRESSHFWDSTGTRGYGLNLPNADVTLYLNLQSRIGGEYGSLGSDIPTYFGGRVGTVSGYVPPPQGSIVYDYGLEGLNPYAFGPNTNSVNQGSPYSSSTVAGDDIGEVGPIKQVQPYTKGEYIGYKSMDPAIGYSTGEPSGAKSDAGDDDIPDITLPNRRWPPKRPEWKTALAIPNPLSDLVNPVTGAVQPKSKEQQDLEAINSAVAPESANPLQALGIAAGIELIKSLPDFASMGSDGSLPKPPEFAFGGGLLKSMEDFVGEEWDGTVPSHVTMPTEIEGYGLDVTSTGELGPYGNPSFANALTKRFPIPNQGKINSYTITLKKNKVHGGIRYVFLDGNGYTDHWRSFIGVNGPTQMLHWISDTPGGPPKTNAYGKPIVVAGQVGTILDTTQVYDLSFITDEGKGPAGLDAQGKPFYFGGSEDTLNVILPVVDKTYFYNVALVSNSMYWEATGTVPGPGDLVTYAPDPSLYSDEDYEYFLGAVPRQARVAIGRQRGSASTTAEQFLEVHMIRTFSDSTESILYIGKDATIEPFIGITNESYPSNAKKITEWENIEGVAIQYRGGEYIPDIGFDSKLPLSRGQFTTSNARRYVIPTDGTIAVAEFSFGLKAEEQNNGRDGFQPNYLRNNSTFGLRWTAPGDDLNCAWYDLDLMPIAWMSSEPGGEPQTLVDGSIGLIIKLEKAGAIYKAQQLLSTTESKGSDRATFPIIKKKYFVNVAVVSASTADTLVAAGTAPSPEQCESWSITDPALGYIGNELQFLEFDLENRINDKSDKLIGS